MISYRVIRSDRRSLALEVTREGEVLVRSPRYLPEAALREFAAQHEQWILKTLEKQKQRHDRFQKPDEDEIIRLKQAAKEYLPERVEYFSRLTGLRPTGVKITRAETRFGSCSGKNSVCFSCLLMRYPPEAIDYVVLHELAHIKHHNHGKAFWALVEHYMPDYKDRRKLLK